MGPRAELRAAKAVGDRTPNGTAYIERAAEIFDYVIGAGVEPYKGLCGGGVSQCPAPAAPYKNAITAELFITAGMYLHPYTKRLGRQAGFFLGWAGDMWAWLAASGLINEHGLVNDGLDPATCANLLPHNYPAVFQFEAGNATEVTSVVPAQSTICVLLLA